MQINFKEAVQDIRDSNSIETINKLIASLYYQLILVVMHKGESIQPYYRHMHEMTDNEYQQRAKFLEKRENKIDLLTFNKKH